MDRLSSCYFCGEAHGSSLDEYPVVPAEFAGPAETDRTVVLCGSCHRKLDSVMDVVAGAVDGAHRSSTDGDPTDGDLTDGDPTDDGTGGAAVDSDVEPTLEGGPDVLHSVGDDGSPETDSTSGTAPESGSGDEDVDPEGGNESADPEGGDEDVDPEGGDEGGGRSGSGGGGGGGGEDDEDRDGTDRSSSSGPAGDPSLTRLEYNKVMRLLQNREFPVDRDGFVTVAANAYELSHRECERILDMAIEHGLVGEEEGQLVEGEG